MADIAASVLAKLKNKAKASGISYQQCFSVVITEIQAFLEPVFDEIVNEKEWQNIWKSNARKWSNLKGAIDRAG